MYKLKNPIFSFLLVSIFFTSCNGQVKNQPQKHVYDSETITDEQPKMIKTQGKYTYHLGTGLRSDTMVCIEEILEDNRATFGLQQWVKVFTAMTGNPLPTLL